MQLTRCRSLPLLITPAAKRVCEKRRVADTLVLMKWPAALVLLVLTINGVCGAEVESLAPRFTSVERLAPDHLRATREAREQFAKQRQEVPEVWSYEDFRAVIHVPSSAGS